MSYCNKNFASGPLSQDLQTWETVTVWNLAINGGKTFLTLVKHT